MKSVQAVAAHSLLLCFTLLLVLKLDHVIVNSWWFIFLPLWIFHAVVARGRFSLPAPSVPHNRHWAPCHAIVATPLLIAFELLLCIYLESVHVHDLAPVNLKIVFLPLLALEITVLVDNFRMCRALMPGDGESMNDVAVWEMLPVSLLNQFLSCSRGFLYCYFIITDSCDNRNYFDVFFFNLYVF